MFKTLSKTRSANFYSNQVKILLLIVIGALVWNNNDARHFTADMLNEAEQFVRPQSQSFQIGDVKISF